LKRRIRQNKAEPAAGSGQEQALDQVLPKQSPPTPPKRRANRKLLSSSGSARDKKTRNVQAGDQEHAKRCREQHVERSLNIANDVIEQGKAVRGFANERVIEMLIV
jgi:hypothetical protein